MSTSATSAATETPFINFLNQCDEKAWSAAVSKLIPSIHEVDRTATQIWFSFYPLGLYQALAVAREAAAAAKVGQLLLAGITAVRFMTLRQAGLAAFKAGSGQVQIDKKYAQKTPSQILRERARNDSQGLLGFLKTVDKKWTVVFDENDNSAKYRLNNLQDLAWGAADDRSRDWAKVDPRCIEGPIPVECRSASCGTCWVGILGGAEKLGEMGPHERLKLKEFGYIDTNESKPLIRLACKTECFGAVSLVIPSWNGFFGRQIG